MPRILQLVHDWNLLMGMSVYENSRNIVQFAEKHKDQHGHYLPSALHKKKMLTKLFAQEPKMEPMIKELLSSLDSVIYIDSTMLAGDSEVTFAKFVSNLSEPSSAPYTLLHRPYLAKQGVTMQNPKGLLQCGPKTPTPSIFPHCTTVSPLAYFSDQRYVMVNSAGLLSLPHINYGFTSSFTTVVSGTKLFIGFDVTEKNRKIMEQWHLQVINWPEALKLMRELERPQFNYLFAGNTIYLAAGQAHMVLSLQCSAICSFDIANPSVAEWDNTLAGYEGVLYGFRCFLADESINQFERAIQDLRTALEMWKQVKNLPKQRNKHTASASDVAAFIERQEKGLKEMENPLNLKTTKVAKRPRRGDTTQGQSSKRGHSTQ